MTGQLEYLCTPISERRKFMGALVLLALMSCLMPPARVCAYEICDSQNRCEEFAGPAQRIIPLYGAFSEILLALGAGDRIAARTVADADIPELAALPAIGTHMRPNAELILAAKPDVVLQMTGRGEAGLMSEHLRSLGIKVLNFEIGNFEGLFDLTRKLGLLTGDSQAAERLVADWSERLDRLKKAAPKTRARIYYEVREPNLLAAGTKSMVNAIINAAGGENAIRIEKKLARCNEEALLLAEPDFCILQKGPMNPQPTPLAERDVLKTLPCAEDGRNMVVSERFFARPGPNSIAAAELLARQLRKEEK